MIYTIKYNLDPLLIDDELTEEDCFNALVLVNDDTFFREYRGGPETPFYQQFEDWVAASMPGRAWIHSKGVHDFTFYDEFLSDGSERLDYCRQATYLFDTANDLMLFKLAWGYGV